MTTPSNSDPFDPRDVAASFERDGYAIVRDTLDEELLDDLDRFIDYLLETYDVGPVEFTNATDGTEPVEHPFWTRIASDDRILDAVEAVLGPNVVHHHSVFFLKPPNSGNRTKWHQDSGYWQTLIEPRDDVATVWVTPTRTDAENACLRVIPGTHSHGVVEHGQSEGGVVATDEDDTDTADVDLSNVDESRAVDLELSPGDFSLHHPSIFHASHGNTSDRWRKALAIRYTSTDSRMLDPGAAFQSQAFLARGDPAADGQQYQPWPRYDPADDDQFAFDGWEEYNERAREMNRKLDSDRLLSGDDGGDWPDLEKRSFQL